MARAHHTAILAFALTQIILPAALSQRLALTNYTVKDGLVGQSIRCIREDSMGFIWIGTSSGLSRYDGIRFSNYTTLNGLPDPGVNQILPYRDSKMWIVTNSDSTNLFTAGKIVGFPYQGSCPTINSIVAEGQGRYLLAADQGLYEYAGKRFTFVSPVRLFSGNSIGKIAAMNDSTFALTNQDGLEFIRRSGDSFRVIKTPQAAAGSFILVDHTGRLWVTQNPGGVRIVRNMPGDHDKFRSLPLPPALLGLKHTVINCLLEDDTHAIWMGTDKGLLRWQEGSAVQHFTIGIDIGTNNITCLYQDREMNIWIGTQNGICKFARPIVTYYDSEEKLGWTFFLSICADSIRNRVYLPQPDMLVAIDENGEVTNIRVPDTSAGTSVMVAGQEALWLLLSKPAKKSSLLVKAKPLRRGERFLHAMFEVRIPGGNYFKMQPDRRGNLFICGPDGLIALYGTTVCRWPELRKYFNAMTFDHLNHLWLGTYIGGGIYEYQLEYLPHDIHLRLLRHYGGPLYDRIRSAICDNDGNIWFGTRLQGLLRFGLDKGGAVTSQDHWSTRDGLSENWVSALYVDRDHQLWVGTATGIDRISRTQGKYSIRNYGKEINFSGSVTGIAQTPNGDFWLAANFAGVTRFTFSNSIDNDVPVVFTRIFASGSRDSSIAIDADTPRLGYNENNLDFDFTAVTFKNEKLVTYSYWLEGAGKDWSPMSANHSVHLVSLPAGAYTLKVRARLANGLLSDKMAVFHFEILHAFWDTWEFKCLFAGAFLLILYGLYRYRIAQIARVHAVRNNLSKDLHDDIGSALSSINILSAIATGRMQEGHPEQSVSILSRINRYTADISERMSDIVWAINPENETIENLVHRLRRAADETCSASNIELELVVDDDLANRKLRMELRKNIYLIAKEAMNNAIRHAGCSRISVHFRATPKGLILAVADDGSGFDAATCAKGNGLKNMASRAKEICAELQLESFKGSTKLTLVAPVP